MALMTSGEAKRRCLVCGSPDFACGGHHADQEVTAVDMPSGRGERSKPATVTARAVVNGTETFFRTTPEEAERNGWQIVGEAGAQHAKRSAPNTARSLEDHSVEELRTMASGLGIEGRSKLKTKKALVRAITKARAGT